MEGRKEGRRKEERRKKGSGQVGLLGAPVRNKEDGNSSTLLKRKSEGMKGRRKEGVKEEMTEGSKQDTNVGRNQDM